MNEHLIENAISRWRTYVERHGSLSATEMDVLEDRLSGQAGDLLRLGLSPDEAFQVAVQRISRFDAATRAFVRDHAARWNDGDQGASATPGPGGDQAASVTPGPGGDQGASATPGPGGNQSAADTRGTQADPGAADARGTEADPGAADTRGREAESRAADTRGTEAEPRRADTRSTEAEPGPARSGEAYTGERGAAAAGGGGAESPYITVETALVLCLAAGAALAIKVPALFGYAIDDDDVNQFYALNISFFAFPFVTAYFAWKRGMDLPRWGWLIPPFFAVMLLCNVYPFSPGSDTAVLTTLHAPVALWLVVGWAFADGNWRAHGPRMDFVRFSGQLFILFVLIALGGGVLTGITLTLFNALGVNLQWAASSWIIPCGAMGAIVVAAWLVETGQGAIEQVAPVLTRIFTPLFTVMLLSFLVVLVWTGRGIHVQREMLIAFDVLLIVVLGLVLYSVSARDPTAPPGVFDGMQIALIMAALVVDALVLAAMTARIAEFGFTPNRMCAMGLNVVLFVNLAWTARLYIGFMRYRGPFTAVERWQTGYLPVFSAWALFVVAVFPLVFGFN